MKDISFKKEVGKFLGLFLILYLIVFVVLNVTGWLIRPKKIESSSVLPLPQKFEEEKSRCVFSEKPNSIFVPEIGIEAPLVFSESEEEKFLAQALNKGVVHYPQSDLPGEKGEIIILGHSAPPGWPKIHYDWVFSDLNKLELGDEIYVFFENCQYVYKVSEKYFLEKGQELPEDLTNSESVLVLISCWPPGKDLKRIAVKTKLINN